jgi:hypothetical protein
MEFAIVNAQDYSTTRVLLKVIVNDPKDYEAATQIADAIDTRLAAIVTVLHNTSRKQEALIATMPPEDGGLGRWFYFLNDMYRILEPLFERFVWECIHDVVGDELD